MNSEVRAAVLTAPGSLEQRDLPDPGQPGPGQVLVRPEAVGICGSDLHYFDGDLGALTGDSDWFPRVLGHELSAIVEAVGEGVDGLRFPVGCRVAVWPLETCGSCYACSHGRENACYNMRIIGVHRDGGLSQRLLVQQGSVFRTSITEPEIAAFAEPLSVAVHALARAGITPDRPAGGTRIAVLGAGPIGQAVVFAASAWGASTAVVDPKQGRRAMAQHLGAELGLGASAGSMADELRQWGDGFGPDIVIDTTGVPSVLAQAVDLVARGGNVVVVGLTGGSAPFSSGVLPEKEVSIHGASCATRTDFASAVRLAETHQDSVAALVSHVVPVERAKDAFALAHEAAAGTMKVVVRLS
ncbi:Oxidoreductase, Zn-dependent and NAD(P)-binding protein [Arthrobacter crystallopoietes BAB-32]|uniref:Oxidoreductase, Zn-dependent and NAD(P)-binding protein n=1 Tax=Arthrobacter crystallopoietes BAB-32 TaxID=1246476 RepID=N1V328_9MICC|nr:alcohol dehydrogenase catalytic domain-containing protein [Arthrobacter crystallopoietes]EMY34472.1 Oxidoreductase, Zn-dependent and NAD(P)-binding protein [Arthrobacter crystallopoietes BAB-32]